jgi:cell wall-associated NlpC family hydrolase
MIKPKSVTKSLFIGSAVTGMVLSAHPPGSSAYAHPQTVKQTIFDTNETLRFGYRGQAVRDLQMALASRDYYHDRVDGIYGPGTQSAVRSYQKKYELHVDGIAGSRTLSSLFAKRQTEQTITQQPKISPQTKNNLEYGDRGKSVKKVQNKLRSLGYYADNIDGIFGDHTQTAVSQYQRANGLLVDGIVGPQTRSSLFSQQQKKNNEKTSRVPSTNSELITNAKQLVGTPYEWGGTTPEGFDCSGFLKYVFENNGMNIPRTVSDIWNYGISVEQPRVGDLVFFETYKPGPSHAGIYIGNGKFLHSSSDGVMTSKMNLDYWQSRYLGAKKIVQQN